MQCKSMHEKASVLLGLKHWWYQLLTDFLETEYMYILNAEASD